MKKIYSLLAVVALTAMVNAQTTETYTVTGTNAQELTNGTVGSVSYSWSIGAGTTTPKYYNTGAAGRLYAKNTLTLQVPTGNKITNVILTGSAGGDYLASTYSINGGADVTAPKTGTADYTIVPSTDGRTFVFTAGPNATSGHSRIKSVTITYSPTLAVADATKGKANLVKNTVVANELIFGTAGKVSIVNMNGQVVKTAEVSENSRLDVSSLAKGAYVVTAVVNGQTVSQKIIKK